MEKKKRLTRYYFIAHKLMKKQSTTSSVQKRLESLRDKEFILQIPIGGNQNG